MSPPQEREMEQERIASLARSEQATFEIAARLLKERDAFREALEAALGYLTNAKIDLETGAPKRTAIQTIEGGLKVVRAALAKVSP